MLSLLITIAIGLAQWLIYTALLWGMIKVQRLNYKFLGLIGSSLLATGLGYIPVVGTYIGWAVLVICLWKCTGADIAPDVLFTVGVAGALMFCVNLFAIGWLLGNLHLVSPALAAAYGSEPDDELAMDAEFDEEEFGAPATVNGTPWGETNVATPAKALLNKVTFAARKAPAAPPSVHLSVKGVSLGARQKSALIAHGKQIHDVRPGDMFTVESGQGRVTLVCEEINAEAVKLTADGAPLTLNLR